MVFCSTGTEPPQDADLTAGSLGFAYLPAMLHHVKVKLVDLLRWDQVFQYLMGPLDGDPGIDQSQSPGYPEDMGIYRQGRFAQREEEYTGGRFRPYPGQLPQPGFGLSYIQFIKEAQVKATLQALNLLENELYPPGFDFG